MRPTRLRTAFSDQPIGLDPSETPDLSWILPAEKGISQAAYRIQIASAAADFTDPIADTGHVASRETTGIPCPGTLEPQTRYHWRVKVWTSSGTDSEWSEPSTFETGLASDDWQGAWIAAPDTDNDPDPVPALRRTFELDDEIESARLHVATGGTHVARLNGHRISDNELDPAFTDYEERVLSVTHDVTEHLQPGENTLGLLLGRDRYAMLTESVWGWQEAPWHADRPTVLSQLEVDFENGESLTISSTDEWEAAPSATRFDSLFAGEHFDARERLGPWTDPTQDDSGTWQSVTTVDGPDGSIVHQVMQPMRVVECVTPDSITEPADDVYVFDLGEMIAGWIELTVEASAGTTLTVTHAEQLDEDGLADNSQGHVDADLQTDQYIAGNDDSETWSPQFTYRGFRYVQINGLPSEPETDLLTGVYVHSNLEEDWSSAFDCSNELLGQIHENTRRGLLNNQHGIPTDTPMFEKNGWTGDVQASAEAAIYNFDMWRFYRKWLDDCADAQRENGELPPIIPTSDWGYEGSPVGGMDGPLPAWDGTYIFLTWNLYRYYGDRATLEGHYEGLVSLLEYFRSVAEDDIIEEGLGDWLPPGSGDTADTMRPPEGPAITSTGYYYRMAEIVSQAAGLLGEPIDERQYRTLADDIATAFHERFWDDERGYYRTGSVDDYRQTSNIFPLTFGLVPEDIESAVANRLVEDITEARNGHLNTGFHGTKYLLPTLAAYDFVDTAYTVASQDSFPSWGHWIVENDATAIYEAWELDSRSRDHPPYGSIDEFNYAILAGITPAAPGFDRVGIRPRFPSDLESVAATVDTIHGPVRSAWEKFDDGLRMEITIPGNVIGTVTLPFQASDVTIQSQTTDEAALTCQDSLPGRSVWDVPAGTWSVISQ